MKQELLTEVLLEMREHVDNGQLKQLEKVMRHILFHYHITKENTHDETSKKDWIELFIAAKRIEGCSAKTLVYYRNTIDAMVEYVEKDIVQITTDDIRKYLMDYQNEKGLSKVTVDNIRRIMSSFFAWLEDEKNYIVKSPARRIHKIRVSIQTNSLHGGMAFRIASSQDSFPVMGFCFYPRFSNNLSNKCPKSTQNTPVCNKTH